LLRTACPGAPRLGGDFGGGPWPISPLGGGPPLVSPTRHVPQRPVRDVAVVGAPPRALLGVISARYYTPNGRVGWCGGGGFSPPPRPFFFSFGAGPKRSLCPFIPRRPPEGGVSPWGHGSCPSSAGCLVEGVSDEPSAGGKIVPGPGCPARRGGRRILGPDPRGTTRNPRPRAGPVCNVIPRKWRALPPRPPSPGLPPWNPRSWVVSFSVPPPATLPTLTPPYERTGPFRSTNLSQANSWWDLSPPPFPGGEFFVGSPGRPPNFARTGGGAGLYVSGRECEPVARLCP